MRFRWTFVSFFSLLFLPWTSNAQWPQAAFDYRDQILAETRFADPYEATVWSGVRFNNPFFLFSKPKPTWFPTTFYNSGQIEVMFHKAKKRAPLILYLPGIFAKVHEGASLRHYLIFKDQGYHFLGAPNTWSATALQQIPVEDPGHFESDAQMVLELLETAIDRIGWDRIERIDLVAESYGAFQALPLLLEDFFSVEPRIDGHISLFSPPIHLQSAIRELDQLMVLSEPAFDQTCKDYLDSFDIVQDFRWADNDSGLSAEATQCSEPIIARSSFHQGLAEAALLLHDQHGLNLAPDPTIDTQAFEDWKASLTFQYLADEFGLSSTPYLNDLELSWFTFWLSALDPITAQRVRIMTSEDDFLNDPSHWIQNPYYPLAEPQLINLPWGGHLGYRGLSETYDFFERLYPKP